MVEKESGNARAQYILGKVFYYSYETIEKNEKQSAHWIRKSYENGNSKAKTFWEENELWKYK